MRYLSHILLTGVELLVVSCCQVHQRTVAGLPASQHQAKPNRRGWPERPSSSRILLGRILTGLGTAAIVLSTGTTLLGRRRGGSRHRGDTEPEGNPVIYRRNYSARARIRFIPFTNLPANI